MADNTYLASLHRPSQSRFQMGLIFESQLPGNCHASLKKHGELGASQWNVEPSTILPFEFGSVEEK